MTTATTLAPFAPVRPAARFELGPIARAAVGLVGVGVTAACGLAAIRIAAGLAPSHPNTQSLAVMIHVATVLPAVPLGAWLMLSRKGTARHKQLGKVWIVLEAAVEAYPFYEQTGFERLQSGPFFVKEVKEDDVAIPVPKIVIAAAIET